MPEVRGRTSNASHEGPRSRGNRESPREKDATTRIQAFSLCWAWEEPTGPVEQRNRFEKDSTIWGGPEEPTPPGEYQAP